jgi:hypothetical protein
MPDGGRGSASRARSYNRFAVGASTQIFPILQRIPSSQDRGNRRKIKARFVRASQIAQIAEQTSLLGGTMTFHSLFAEAESSLNWLDRVLRPEVLGPGIGAIAIIAVAAVIITVVIVPHRERMAKLERGIDPEEKAR